MSIRHFSKMHGLGNDFIVLNALQQTFDWPRARISALADRHRDHAWFIAFAPVDKPQIAVAVILENAGWGVNAAPVARHLIDYYLLQLKQDKVSKEITGARRTANPLLQLSAPMTKQQNSIQAAFEAVAQEKAARANPSFQAASAPAVASAPAAVPASAPPAKRP